MCPALTYGKSTSPKKQRILIASATGLFGNAAVDIVQLTGNVEADATAECRWGHKDAYADLSAHSYDRVLGRYRRVGLMGGNMVNLPSEFHGCCYQEPDRQRIPCGRRGGGAMIPPLSTLLSRTIQGLREVAPRTLGRFDHGEIDKAFETASAIVAAGNMVLLVPGISKT